MNTIQAKFLSTYSKADGTKRNRYALQGSKEDIAKVVEHQGQYMPNQGKPVNGQVLFTGPGKVLAPQAVLPLKWAEGLDRFIVDTDASTSDINMLNLINDQQISDTAKARLEGNVIDNSIISRASNRVQLFAAPTQSAPAEAEASADNSDLTSALEESPQEKPAKGKGK